MQIDGYQLVTVADAGPDLAEELQGLIDAVWPLYVQEAAAAGYSDFTPDWWGIFSRHPQYQFGLYRPQNNASEDGSEDASEDSGLGELVAVGNAVPLAWSGDLAHLPDAGWDWALHQSRVDHEAGSPPTLLSAVSATVAPSAWGQGVSRAVIQAMRALARQNGLPTLIAPVRPVFKSRYPLIPMADYAQWTNRDGLPFDPWMRVHARLGATVAHPCERSMSMGGRVADWERWLAMPLPGSGQYVHPDLLAPLQVDRRRDRGIYVEPNVWMVHGVS